jgi:predicted alpha/beta-fold hydrolase
MTVQTILIKSSSGSDLHADYYQISANPEESAIVILCHGLPGERHEEGRFPKMAELCNNVGFDALCIDFRGSGENVREPIMLSKNIKDLEDTYAWALNIGYLHIGTLGLSFGGISSLMANLPDRKCAVFWAPAFYVARGFRKNQGKFRFALKKWLLKKTHKQMQRKSSGKNQLPVIITYEFYDEIDRIDVHPR